MGFAELEGAGGHGCSFAAELTLLTSLQIEVLEVCLLFYKDFLHPADRLLECTKMFKQHNYGIRQPNKHLIGVHGNHLLSQIR